MPANSDSDEARFSLRLPRVLLDKLRTTAQQNRRSINGEVLAALEQYVAAKAKKEQG